MAQEIAEFQHLKLKIFQGSISLSSLKENILLFQSWRLALDEKSQHRHEVLMVRISHYKLMPTPHLCEKIIPFKPQFLCLGG